MVCSEKTCERIGKIKATEWGGVDNPIISHGYGAGMRATVSWRGCYCVERFSTSHIIHDPRISFCESTSRFSEPVRVGWSPRLLGVPGCRAVLGFLAQTSICPGLLAHTLALGLVFPVEQVCSTNFDKFAAEHCPF